MLNQITNKKGEKLYILIDVTNNIKPYITVNTWVKCMERLKGIITEIDSSKFYTSIARKKIDEENHTAEVLLHIIEHGLGSDFMKYIIIRPLCSEAW